MILVVASTCFGKNKSAVSGDSGVFGSVMASDGESSFTSERSRAGSKTAR